MERDVLKRSAALWVLSGIPYKTQSAQNRAEATHIAFSREKSSGRA
jgi:hypothetical protein